MKSILLLCAITASACASEPSAAVKVSAHKVGAEGGGDGHVESPPSALHPLTPTDEALATSTTTTLPPTTTTTEPVPVTTTPTTVYAKPRPAVEAGTGACGGSLPPCSVLRAESGGNIRAVNATGCSGRGCFGKWQFDPRTSRGLGYPLTMDQYPESVQDEAARTLWAGGAGCSHWGAC